MESKKAKEEREKVLDALEEEAARARVLKTAQDIVKERQAKIEALKNQLNTKNNIVLMQGNEVRPIECLFTGWHAYDYFAGGDPKGHFTIDYGLSGVGKTTMNYRKMAMLQQQGIVCIVIPMENCFHPGWCQKQGVNMNDLLVVTTGETFDETCDNYISVLKAARKLGLPIFTLVDSIHGQETQKGMKKKAGAHLKDKSIADETPGTLPKQIGAFIRRIQKDVYESECSMSIIGQARDNYDSMRGGLVLTGGHALKHHSFRIIQWRIGAKTLWPVRKVNGADVVVGHMAVGKIERTKMNGNLGQELNLPFLNQIGPSINAANVDSAIALGIITGAGAHYTWEENGMKFHGISNVYSHFEASADDSAILSQMLYSRAPIARTVAPIEEEECQKK